ncbi:putative signal transduction protein [Desulfatibacillum aliphaticivorans]|uniref:Signal transduction protein n=1 Tax=Desulfatibacillum aliphaticivorans TaxID=218208 RepID=B8FI12_DESAL|nr:HDOD domain-containing protein [Desulfatibacillum aliphaticivorans]ACL02579.1 putative signal transduction protein [Desulfatibacillum aliphaticivorans]
MESLKTLVVDDEEVSRLKLSAILEEVGECAVVGSGPEAIEAVRKALNNGSHFDLITMDVSMPLMDGIETVFEIRRLEQDAPLDSTSKSKIMMITANNDRDCLITCVQAGCNDYLIKPFDPEKVFHRLRNLKLLSGENGKPGAGQAPKKQPPVHSEKVEIGKEVLKMFRSGETNFPSPPGVYKQFMTLIEAGADAGAIADLLKEDINISFHLISVSNSPVYRGVKDNRNLHQAISRLGLQLTRKYVDLLCNRTIFTTKNKTYERFMEKLWEHSVACAHAAQTIVDVTGMALELDAFTLGVLHDVGKMVLIQIVAEIDTKGKLPYNTNPQDVLSTLSAYHGPFGEAVLNKWEFPREFGLIAKHHDDANCDGCDTKALPLIQLANLITKTIGMGYDAPIQIDLEHSEPAKYLNINEKTMEAIRSKVKKLMSETQNALG